MNAKNTTISTATMVEPTGVEPRTDTRIPVREHSTDRTAEHIVTDLKLLNIRMAERAGNMTSAEMSSEPTRFIAMTIIIAMTIAISRL